MSAVVQLDPIDAMGIVRWTEGTKIEPGKMYVDMPNALYHGGPGISKSGLDLIRRSPAHYKFMRAHPKPPTAAMFFGSALHTLVLEGEEKFLSEYERFDMTRQSKEGKATYQAIIDSGKTPISARAGDDPIWDASDYDTLFRMRDAVMQHADASLLLSNGVAEVAGYWVDTEKTIDELDQEKPIKGAHGLFNMSEDPTFKLCKMKMDWYNFDHSLPIDLKSTTDASYTAFARSVVEYYYHVQDAYYRQGLRYIGWPAQDFVFIAVEKEPPYGVAGYVISQEGKQLGRSQFRKDLALYLACKEADVWPSYQDHLNGRTLRDLDIPKYAASRIF
jgi:hypothetical protein